MIDPEFMKRAQEFAQPIVNDLLEKRRLKINQWNHDNPEKLKICRENYEKTAKGQIAVKKRIRNRVNNFKKAKIGLTKEERQLIQEFYNNTPEGYDVDHIIPLCKSGMHRMSNLQYLPWIENAKKASKMPNSKR